MCAMGGCALKESGPPQPETVASDVALDRALRTSSLVESEQPFHLILEISPAATAHGNPDAASDSEMYAKIELFWLNRLTYRTVIHSKAFSQIRIVNGRVVEEHDKGDFYPRWIQNFVDAILEPAPKAAVLRRASGTVPIGANSQPCIDTSGQMGGAADRGQDEESVTRVCFRDLEPRIASSMDFTRYVAFDDFAPFGSVARQQIARTLVNVLPANVQLKGRITRLEPLRRTDYSLLKAKEFTLPASQIQTTLVSQRAAAAMLETPLAKSASGKTFSSSSSSSAAGIPNTIYVRTDRTGKVREAYCNRTDQFHQQDAAVSRALMLKFKPLVVRGVALQMEAPFAIQ